MKEDNCIFCKIIAGEIPSRTIYEDDDFKVILDANPASKGHALILPKEHCANIYEISEELLAKTTKLAKRLAGHMTAVLDCDGFNLLQNNGEVAGQTVFHFHMHLIPRYENDGIQIAYKPLDLTDVQIETMRQKISSGIK